MNVLHSISKSLGLEDGYVQAVLKNLFDEINTININNPLGERTLQRKNPEQSGFFVL